MTTPSPLLTRLSEIKVMAEVTGTVELLNLGAQATTIIPALVEFARVAVEALEQASALSNVKEVREWADNRLQTLTAILAQTKTK